MKGQWVALAVAIVSILPAPGTAGVREERPNLIGGELGGRGVAFTLNYERFVSNHVGLGAGVMAIKTSDGGVTVIPLYASFTPGNTHSPYFSAGTTVITGGGDLRGWEGTTVLNVSFGYQYHSASGFFVRPFFTYLKPSAQGTGDDYFIWPGLTIGGSF